MPVEPLPCGPNGASSSGPTVQEVCVVANAAPDDVHTWSRVIEDDGTIFYLDDSGHRYDGTLPTGFTIVSCPAASDSPSVQVLPLCDTGPDGVAVPFLRHYITSSTGETTTTTDTTLDGTTPYTVVGTVTQCPPSEDHACAVKHVIESCRCDDTDGDGIGETGYVTLLGVACDGTLTSLGTYTPDYTAPYVPVHPADCGPAYGAGPAIAVQARRTEVAAGASWSTDDTPLLQAVAATAHDGTATVTTADGSSSLREGETASWSVIRDGDGFLTGPLTITAGTGSVTITFTAAVTNES